MARKNLPNGQWLECFQGFFILFLTSCPEWLKCMLLAPPFEASFTTLSENARIVIVKSTKNLIGQEDAIHKYLQECMKKAMPSKPEETKSLPADVAQALQSLKQSVEARGGAELTPAAQAYLGQIGQGSSQRTAPLPPKQVVSWACVWKQEGFYKSLESTQERVFGIFRQKIDQNVEVWVLRSDVAWPFPCDDQEYFNHGKVVEHHRPTPPEDIVSDLPPMDPSALKAAKKKAASRKRGKKVSAMDQNLDEIPGLREDLEDINGRINL